MSTPTPIAAIDVGTNSVHMVVASVDTAGFTVLATEKEVVRLGEGSENDTITGAAIERGVAALRRMRLIAEAHGARVRAVATSAVREAVNRDEFLAVARAETGIDVEVISGSEEARLIHLGVSRSLDLRRGSVLTIDIGGGSTEFCVAVNGKLRISQSLKLGAVRMTGEFVPAGTVTEAGVRRMRDKIRSTIAPLVHDIRRIGFDQVVVSSGTTETLARMVAVRREADLPLTFNGFEFEAREVRAVTEEILATGETRDRIGMPGLESKRADIIVAGAVILDEVLRAVRAQRLAYSDYALREGVLVDAAQRLGVLAAEPVDAGFESVRRLAQRCSVDMEHSEHVAHLAVRILRAVGRHYEVEAGLERLLTAAALLANTGNAVSYSRHHLHSYYIIRNADLVGFDDEEIEVIALVARYHRKSPPKESHEDLARLGRDRRHDVQLMAAVLRIATGLDRSHDQSIREIGSSMRDGSLVLSVRHDGATEESVELNIHTAESRVEALEEYLGDPVSIRDGGVVRN